MAASSVEHPRCLLRVDGDLVFASETHLLTMCGRGERVIVTSDSFAAVRQAGPLKRALGLTPLEARRCGVLLELHIRGNKVASSERRGLRLGKHGWRIFPLAFLCAWLGLAKGGDEQCTEGG